MPSQSETRASYISLKRFYADDSFWNVPIPPNPSIDPRSSEVLNASIIAYRRRANFTNSTTWGISVVSATPNSVRYKILCKMYDCRGAAYFPIPKDARPDTGSDHHLVVIDPEANQELDLWLASYDPGTDTWSAGSRYIHDLYGWGACGPPGAHCGNGVAAGFNEMGGVVRPEEILQGHIDHALSITSPYTRRHDFVCPATHTDGKHDDPNAIPEGAHLQLDPSFNVDAQSWPPWEKIIAKALQTYGAYVSDSGGTVAIYGQSDMNSGNLPWNSVGVPSNGPSLANLPWDRFRILSMKYCN